MMACCCRAALSLTASHAKHMQSSAITNSIIRSENRSHCGRFAGRFVMAEFDA
jgi:hypothetical protein